MRIMLNVLWVTVLGILGTSSFANSQTSITPEQKLVNNIKIVAIESIEIRESATDACFFLDMVTEMRNENDDELKLRDGKFSFSLGVNKDLGQELGKDDTAQREWEVILKPKSSHKVKFEINLGSNQEQALHKVIPLVNALGKKPPRKIPYFSFDGSVFLGKLSTKGWTSVRVPQFEWNFEPTNLQEEVLFTIKPSS